MNSLRQSSGFQERTRALLSIRPEFALAILRGEKKYEFRRIIFSRRVDVVVIYMTAPVRRVVAEFDVMSIITEPLPVLWRCTRQYAGVDEDVFYRYFDGLHYGHAIAIGEVRAYDSPFSLCDQFGLRPPQSFVYLDA